MAIDGDVSPQEAGTGPLTPAEQEEFDAAWLLLWNHHQGNPTFGVLQEMIWKARAHIRPNWKEIKQSFCRHIIALAASVKAEAREADRRRSLQQPAEQPHVRPG